MGGQGILRDVLGEEEYREHWQQDSDEAEDLSLEGNSG